MKILLTVSSFSAALPVLEGCSQNSHHECKSTHAQVHHTRYRTLKFSILCVQGMLGETYDRFIAGDAIKDTINPMHLPDDKKFHGLGTRSQYKMDNYWDTNHVRVCPLNKVLPAVSQSNVHHRHA